MAMLENVAENIAENIVKITTNLAENSGLAFLLLLIALPLSVLFIFIANWEVGL